MHMNSSHIVIQVIDVKWNISKTCSVDQIPSLDATRAGNVLRRNWGDQARRAEAAQSQARGKPVEARDLLHGDKRMGEP